MPKSTGRRPYKNRAKNPIAVAFGKLGASKGGIARARNLSAERRREIARKAILTRWKKSKRQSTIKEPKTDVSSVFFKFCSAQGALAILKGESMFVTSALDFNDPFEMRPSWTDAHAQRFFEDQSIRSRLTEGLPVQAVISDNETAPAGNLPYLPPQKPTPVDRQSGIADHHNAEVFREVHTRFRILSLVSGLCDITQTHPESDSTATLMWSHYADQFQGVCLAVDGGQFYNGIRTGGFAVEYSHQRQSLPPGYYDCWHTLQSQIPGSVFQKDPASGLHVTPAARADAVNRRFRDLLTYKSPVWKYESEVRMIYGLTDLLASDAYQKISFPCEKCRAGKLAVEQCDHAQYRDAIKLPASAIRAVIFGTDCPFKQTQEILQIASAPSFSAHFYWSSLHSEKYSVQYARAAPDYIKSIQEDRGRQFAQAKNHIYLDGKKQVYRLAKKGVNYVHQRPKKSASDS